MSHLSAIFQNCPNIYAGLMDVFRTCPPNGALSERIPHAEFLMSDINRNGLAATIHPSDNKVRKVTVGYQQRPQESEVTEATGLACVGTTKRGYTYTEYDIDTTQYLFYEGFISSTDLERNCDNSTQYFLQQLAAGLDTIERAAATKISTQSVALNGTWGSDHPSGLIVGDKFQLDAWDTNDKPNEKPFMQLNNALARAGFCSPTFIVGGNDLYEYYHIMRKGCCASSGVDLGAIFDEWGQVVAYDRRTKTALGTEAESIALQAGAQQVLYFITGNWIEGGTLPFMPGGDYATGVFLMPRLGIPVDVNLSWTCNNGIYGISFTYKTVVKVVGMPADMFHPGDIFDGVTGSVIIEVV